MKVRPEVLRVLAVAARPVREETWIPVRYVQHDTICAFCWTFIPRSKPGARVGDRGTKAWLCKERGYLECIKCREAAA